MDYSDNEMIAKVNKSNTKGMGIASMILGIVSLVLFCSCCNIVLAILAIVFGFVQICTKTNKNGKAFAWVGVGTGFAAVICTVVFWAMCFSETSIYTKTYDSESEEFIEEYYDFMRDFYNINPDMEEYENQNNNNLDDTL